MKLAESIVYSVGIICACVLLCVVGTAAVQCEIDRQRHRVNYTGPAEHAPWHDDKQND